MIKLFSLQTAECLTLQVLTGYEPCLLILGTFQDLYKTSCIPCGPALTPTVHPTLPTTLKRQ